MSTFNFLPQAAPVEGLLNACLAALPHLPAPEKAVLVTAMREFEARGVALMWSPADVDEDDEYELTDKEARGAISQFLAGSAPSEADRMAIDTCAREVLAERRLYLRVRYGAEAGGSASVIDLPFAEIEALATREGLDTYDAMVRVFMQHTSCSSMHILSCDLEARYNQYGERVER